MEETFDAKARIEYLVTELNRHTELYDNGVPEISDKEWDDMYFELAAIERERGYILSNSPTQKVNYTVVNELQLENVSSLILVKVSGNSTLVKLLHPLNAAFPMCATLF